MNNTLDLRYYLTIVLKWWWLLLLLTLVAAATGYAVSSRQSPVYQASTTIIIGQSIQSSDLSASDLLLSERLGQTYASIARRQPVLQGVVEALSLSDSWQELKSRVTVAPVRDTQLLEISVEAVSAEEARVTADELARQLILLSPTELQNQEQNENRHFVQQRLNSLQTKLEGGQARLETLNDTMSGVLEAEQVQEIQAEINTLENLLTEWENNYTQLVILVESKKSPNYLAIIEPAQASTLPVRPKVIQNTLLAAIVGLLLAAGLVFLLEYLDDTLKSPDDLSQMLGITTLGAIGRIKGKDRADKLLPLQDLFSPGAESYRMIRSNIQFASVDRPAQSIMITSSIPDEGKSTTVANLGIVMAQSGKKTIIVDADLRKPTQHEIFQLPNLAGLTDMLCAPDTEPQHHLRKTAVENLYLVTSGVLPPNPSELLGSARMGQMITDLNSLADIVIYDSPPTLVVTDALVLSNRVDGVIVVTKAGQTRLGAARQTILNLQQASAHILGGVLNGTKDKRGGNYYYYHRYASSNGRGPKPGQTAPPAAKKRWIPFL